MKAKFFVGLLLALLIGLGCRAFGVPSPSPPVLVAALLIGTGCRLLDIPSPAPPKLQGALLVVAMTCGYLLG